MTGSTAYPPFESGRAAASGTGSQYSSAYGYPSAQSASAAHPAPSSPGHYPSVPGPVLGTQQTYTGMYAAAGAPPGGPVGGYPTSNSAPATTPDIGAGWTAEAVQLAPAANSGQFGHYGKLQYAPSFNTASVSGAAAPQPVAGAAQDHPQYAAPQAVATSEWILQGKLPQQPSSQLIGPFVRFNDFAPATAQYALSVLVVSHPSLANNTVQLHYAVNAPATQPAQSQVLDDFMGELC